jgi:pescadillo protein
LRARAQIFMRRLKRAVGRQELDVARRMYASRPAYSLDHLIKERYPRFADALGDCDDALTLVHLLATFPAERPLSTSVTAAARTLAREWQYYVARAHALRRVFFSVKGAYLSADVAGVTVTWLVPWAFSQALPADVDYNVMVTFFELHQVRCAFFVAALDVTRPTAHLAAHLAALDHAAARVPCCYSVVSEKTL